MSRAEYVRPDPLGLTKARIVRRAISVVHFAQLTGVRPMIETYPLEKAGEAYARMMSGNAEFRVVLTM
jgi:D-arabinose 1-dehydrogenase-like Zn-dependent alcohol dehydrogenase